MVRYREVEPGARLRQFVSALWILEREDEGNAPQRIVSDGRPALILNWARPAKAESAPIAVIALSPLVPFPL